MDASGRHHAAKGSITVTLQDGRIFEVNSGSFIAEIQHGATQGSRCLALLHIFGLRLAYLRNLGDLSADLQGGREKWEER